MKVLLDSCVWGGALAEIQSAGHDTAWVGTWDRDPGDEEILARAFNEKRIVVTLDKDFGELAIVYEKPHSGIVRLVTIPARQQGLFCLTILDRYSNELEAGAIVTAERERIRIRSSG
jgi:predicted nuclease of predicted toxin-antitoxin system